MLEMVACPVCRHWPRSRNDEQCPECGDVDHPGVVFVPERVVTPPTMSREVYDRKAAEAARDEKDHERRRSK